MLISTMQFTQTMDPAQIERFKESREYHDTIDGLMTQFVDTTNTALKRCNLQAQYSAQTLKLVSNFANNLINEWEAFKDSDWKPSEESILGFTCPTYITASFFPTEPIQKKAKTMIDSETIQSNLK